MSAPSCPPSLHLHWRGPKFSPNSPLAIVLAEITFLISLPGNFPGLALCKSLQHYRGPSFAIFLTVILSSSPCSSYGARTLWTLAWTGAVASCPLPCPPLPRANPAVTLSSPRSVTSTHLSWMAGQRGDCEGRRGGRGRETETREKQGLAQQRERDAESEQRRGRCRETHGETMKEKKGGESGR